MGGCEAKWDWSRILYLTPVVGLAGRPDPPASDICPEIGELIIELSTNLDQTQPAR